MQNIVKQTWMFITAWIFLMIFQFSGTWIYIDGDDAMSIAYHVLGRNTSMQPPYSPYQGMMDKVLGLLPSEEPILRTVAFGITRLASILMVILILVLVFDWLQESGRQYSPTLRAIISVVLLLAVPELFYLGLVYSPTMVAMCFVLLGHLLIKRIVASPAVSKTRHIFGTGISIILFGVGVAFRWNVLAYGLVIASNILFSHRNTESFSDRLKFTISWGLLAVTTSFLMISISGYGFSNIQEKFETILYVINQTGTTSVDNSSFQEILMRMFLTISPLLSPVFGIAILVGIIRMVKDHNPLGYTFLASFLSILPWIRSGVPKFIITALPMLVLAFAFGLDTFLTYFHGAHKAVACGFLSVGLLLPWFIGIQVNREETAWGPGFEMKPYNYQNVEGLDFSIVIGPGMAFPSPEGPRPLYGHGYVFFQGWKDFVTTRSDERQAAIDAALELDIPLLTTGWSPDYYLNILYSMGFQTADPYNNPAADQFYMERKFASPQGKTISILYIDVDGNNISELVSHMQTYPTTPKIVVIGYPQTLRSFYEIYPDAMEYLGPTSAILNLSTLK